MLILVVAFEKKYQYFDSDEEEGHDYAKVPTSCGRINT